MENLKKSFVDIAFDIMSERKTPIKFENLLKKICKIAELTEDEQKNKIGKIYTQLILDERFITINGIAIDLKSRHKFDQKRNRDMEADYNESDFDDVEDEEEKKMQQEEIGEIVEEEETDDIDFDKPMVNNDDENI